MENTAETNHKTREVKLNTKHNRQNTIKIKQEVATQKGKQNIYNINFITPPKTYRMETNN